MSDMQILPAFHDIYVLHLFLSRPQALVIGRLGQHHLSAGHYFHVGSAGGAGGLRSRIGRHLRGNGKRYWHIDTLRAAAEVRELLYTVTDTPLECTWSQALARLPEAFIPIPHFGAGDCRSGCAAHLIGFRSIARPDRIETALANLTPTPIVSLYLAVR